jgi:hypothetical protein
MNKKLADFIVDLAVNPDRARRYAEDAAGELAAAGLSADDQAAILSADTDRVRMALGSSYADHLTQFSGAPKSGMRKKTVARKAKKAAKKAPKKAAKRGTKKAVKKSAKRSSRAKSSGRKR